MKILNDGIEAFSRKPMVPRPPQSNISEHQTMYKGRDHVCEHFRITLCNKSEDYAILLNMGFE